MKLPTFPYNSGTGFIDAFDLLTFASDWNVFAEKWNEDHANDDVTIHAGRRILVEHNSSIPTL